MEEDVKERTKRMRVEEQRRINEHERSSRAYQGRNTTPIARTLAVSLPLVAIAIGLYGLSMYYMKKRLPIFIGESPPPEYEASYDGIREDDAFTTLRSIETRIDPELLDDQKHW